MGYYVSKSSCPQSHRCPLIRICTVGAIAQEGYGLPIIDNAKCIECGKCVKMCAMGAVKKA